MVEAQGFKWEEAFHRYVCCRAAVIHAHYVNGAVKRLIYTYVRTYTFFAANTTDTHDHADSTDTQAITSRINHNDLD